MLASLRLENFAILESWSLDFEAGETVITGETGSGKSLFVDALQFLLGARADRSLQREGLPMLVEGIFVLEEEDREILECLDRYELPRDENRIIILREFTQKSSKIRLNGQAVTLAQLKEIAGRLMDIHSQNAQSLLGNRKNYLPLLDLQIGDPAEVKKEALQKGLRQWRVLREQLESLDLSPEEAAREQDLLRYQIREIDQADLANLEEDALNREYKDLSSSVERLEQASAIYSALAGEGDPLKYRIQAIARELDQLAQKDQELKPASELCWQMQAEAESLQDDLERYRDNVRIDPQRLKEIDQIFRLLQNLRRKYGTDIEEILAFRDRAHARWEELRQLDQNRSEIKASQKKLENELYREAEELTQLRRKAARGLERRMTEELEEMAIPHVEFRVQFTKRNEVKENGQDDVDFMISTNPGEPMQSVSQVASGGEMSRFMLALKILVAEIQRIPSLVFDEIDTGISGRTAQVVAEKMHQLTNDRQILVITHLPQIAALADQHIVVQKEASENRTLSRAHILTEEERVEEQARLIGGVHITEATRSGARDMLRQAKEWIHQSH